MTLVVHRPLTYEERQAARGDGPAGNATATPPAADPGGEPDTGTPLGGQFVWGVGGLALGGGFGVAGVLVLLRRGG